MTAKPSREKGHEAECARHGRWVPAHWGCPVCLRERAALQPESAPAPAEEPPEPLRHTFYGASGSVCEFGLPDGDICGLFEEAHRVLAPAPPEPPPAQPCATTTCVVCQKETWTCEIGTHKRGTPEDATHRDGVQFRDGTWACSEACWEDGAARPNGEMR